jgi:Arc/MetJ-type ribon-helix-helix transcriptional regulator
MKQVIVEFDDVTAARLEKVAPSRTRQRSEFIRAAVRRALDELAESRMAEAYRRQPDDANDAYVDPVAWEGARKKHSATR